MLNEIDVRQECWVCGVHTRQTQCGNCGSMDLTPVKQSRGGPPLLGRAAVRGRPGDQSLWRRVTSVQRIPR